MNTRYNEQFQFSPSNIGNASVKMLLKDFIFEAYEVTREAFFNASDKDKLNFYKSILPYVCAKQDPHERQGEWAPDQSMDTEWIKDWQYRRTACIDKENAILQKNEKLTEFNKLIDIETNNWRKEFYRVACLLIESVANDRFLKKVYRNINKSNFKVECAEVLFKTVIHILEEDGFEPPKPIRIFDRTIYPKFSTDQMLREYKDFMEEKHLIYDTAAILQSCKHTYPNMAIDASTNTQTETDTNPCNKEDNESADVPSDDPNSESVSLTDEDCNSQTESNEDDDYK